MSEKCTNCGKVVKDTQIYGTETKDTHCIFCIETNKPSP